MTAERTREKLIIEMNRAKAEIFDNLGGWWDYSLYLEDLQERATASGLADTFRELLGAYTD